MNIFILGPDPYESAAGHCDKHLSKMILEGAQMLSTAAHMLCSHTKDSHPDFARLYNTTHQNHPCSAWVRQSLRNAEFLVDICLHLNWNRLDCGKKSHASAAVAQLAYQVLAKHGGLPYHSAALTRPALAIPDEFKPTNYDQLSDQDAWTAAVTAYRRYYASKASSFPLEYKGRERPQWLMELEAAQ